MVLLYLKLMKEIKQMKQRKLSKDDRLRIDICVEMYGVELSDLSLYEIDEYMAEKRRTDEELYMFVLDIIENEVGKN